MFKNLGRVAPAATTQTELYAPANGKVGIFSNITIANRSTAATYRIAVEENIPPYRFSITDNIGGNYVSQDGLTWTFLSFGSGGESTFSPLRNVAPSLTSPFFGYAMPVGSNAVFYTSIDGLNTTYVSDIPISNMTDFSRIGGNWVAVNDSGSYAYSSNGTTWTTGTLPSWNSNFMNVSLCNSGPGGTLILNLMRFDGTPTNAAYSTTNGVTWTSRTMPSTADDWSTTKWSFGGGRFGARKSTSAFNTSLGIAFSTDGATWSAGTTPPSGTGQPVFGAGGWFIVDFNNSFQYYTNTNLSGTWTARSVPTGVANDSMFSAGAFVYAHNNTTGELYRTSDLINWSLYGQMDILNYIGIGNTTRFALVADLAATNTDTIVFDASVGANATIVQDLGLVVPHGKKVTVQANSANVTFIGNGSERDI
jgi:hypothetical protein